MAELKDIEGLSPEEKAKRLQQLVDERANELERRQKELEDYKALHKKASEEAIDKVVNEREKSLKQEEDEKKQLAQDQTLDERLSGVSIPTQEVQQPSLGEEETNVRYLAATEPSRDLYQNALGIYQNIDGSVTPEQAQSAGSILYALEQKREDMSAGSYDASEEIRRQADSAFAIAEKILSLYTGGVKRRPPHVL